MGISVNESKPYQIPPGVKKTKQKKKVPPAMKDPTLTKKKSYASRETAQKTAKKRVKEYKNQTRKNQKRKEQERFSKARTVILLYSGEEPPGPVKNIDPPLGVVNERGEEIVLSSEKRPKGACKNIDPPLGLLSHRKIRFMLGGNNPHYRKRVNWEWFNHHIMKKSLYQKILLFKKNIGVVRNKIIYGKFWMNGCGYCEQIKDIWKKVVKTLNSDHKYVNVDIISENVRAGADALNQLTGASVEANGYPTLYKIVNNTVEYYTGERTYENIVNWLSPSTRVENPVGVAKEHYMGFPLYYRERPKGAHMNITKNGERPKGARRITDKRPFQTFFGI